LLQENIYDKFIKKLKWRLETLRVGDPLDKTMDMGAIVNCRQLETITVCLSTQTLLQLCANPITHIPTPLCRSIRNLQMYVDSAREEGAEVIQWSGTLPKGNGFWYPPTIIAGVQTTSKCVVEEVISLSLSLSLYCFYHVSLLA
jgi:aldehyde dehydrogenase (NAD+)